MSGKVPDLKGLNIFQTTVAIWQLSAKLISLGSLLPVVQKIHIAKICTQQGNTKTMYPYVMLA